MPQFDTELNATVVPVAISIHLARIGCYDLSISAYSDTSFLNSFPVSGYAFGSQKIGTFHPDANILNFGQVPVGRDSGLQEIFAVDTIGNISLLPRNVLLPFSSDSFGTPPSNTDLCDSLALGIWFYFQPSQGGVYSDTVSIYDPVTDDSTRLILKGEGVAAGVSTPDINPSLLHISPNPCDRECSVSLDNAPIDRVVVMDALGKQIMDFSHGIGQSISMNTGDVVNGIYFVKVFSGNTVYYARIAVIH